MKMNQKVTNRKNWTKEDLNYLGSSWGNFSIPSIAKNLNRSIEAIKLKAHRTGLTRFIHFGEYITLNQLMLIITKTSNHSAYSGKKYKTLPIVNKKVCKKSFKVIYMKDFWDWLKNNIHKIDLSKTEKFDLGLEPEWVEEKRKADKLFNQYKKTPWTKTEDERLFALLSEFKYGIREISIKLKRTEGAIQRRVHDLKTPMRPLRADNHTPWTESELKITQKLYCKGYKPIIIAEHFNRSAKAIYGLLERHNYFGAGASF